VALVRRSAVIAATTVLALTGLTACSGGGGSAESTSSAPSTTPGRSTATPTPTTSEGGPTGADLKPVATRVIAGGFTSPWGLVFLPDGSALVSERDTARIKRVTPAGRVTTVGQVPGVVPGGEGGLLGLAISPDFDQNRWLYAYFTSDRDNRIVRMKYSGGELGTPHPILTGIAKAGIHNGGRIGFGPDGMLYAGTGEAGLRAPAQDLHSLSGKILRMTPTGKPAPDNPFDNSVVWTYGHRNPQGFAWDDDGRMWASSSAEHLGRTQSDPTRPQLWLAGGRGQGRQQCLRQPGRAMAPTRRHPAASRSPKTRSTWPLSAGRGCGRSR
jgi:glucose/arabinose dehydrogenase